MHYPCSRACKVSYQEQQSIHRSLTKYSNHFIVQGADATAGATADVDLAMWNMPPLLLRNQKGRLKLLVPDLFLYDEEGQVRIIFHVCILVLSCLVFLLNYIFTQLKMHRGGSRGSRSR